MPFTTLPTSAYTTLDATKLTGNLPAISGASLTGIDGGKILQIKNIHSTATTATSSSSYTATALDLSITPTSASSKIIVHCSTNTDNEASGRQAEVGLWREIGAYMGSNSTLLLQEATVA